MVPGIAFVTGGARILEQELHPYLVELNHSLLTVGSVFQCNSHYLFTNTGWGSSVMALVVPAAYFAGLDRGSDGIISTTPSASIINDAVRGDFLKMSRGLAIILLLVYDFYIASTFEFC
jgi:Ca2+:H+ antiporter